MSNTANDNPKAGDGFKYSVETFDKNIMFIASGSFGVSFAFIKDIIKPLKDADSLFLLYWAWYSFGLAMFFNLLSHYVSMRGMSWAEKNMHLSDDVYNSGIDRWNRGIKWLNLASMFLIPVGAFLLIQFIKQNL